MLRYDIVTLFPDLVQPVLGQSMLKQVPEKRCGWRLRVPSLGLRRSSLEFPGGWL